jgi:hypothetical protein
MAPTPSPSPAPTAAPTPDTRDPVLTPATALSAAEADVHLELSGFTLSTFTAAAQLSVRSAFAAEFGVDVGSVVITTITAAAGPSAGRRLLVALAPALPPGRRLPAAASAVAFTVTMAVPPAEFHAKETQITNLQMDPGLQSALLAAINAELAQHGVAVVTAISALQPATVQPAQMSYTENSAPMAVLPRLALHDADSALLSSAVVTVELGYDAAGDVLESANRTWKLATTWSVAAGALTISGNDTAANYLEALHSVTFHSTSDDPTRLGASRRFSLTVTDQSGRTSSRLHSGLLMVIRLPDAPVVQIAAGKSVGAVSYAELGAPVVLAPAALLTDPDNVTVARADVTISSGFQPFVGGEFNSGSAVGDSLQLQPGALSAAAAAGVSATWDPASATLSLVGAAPPAVFQSALRGVTFSSGAAQPDDSAARVVTFWANDGVFTSAAGVSVAVSVFKFIRIHALAADPTPAAVVVAPGLGTATRIAVNASGSFPHTFTWLKDGAEIGGCTVGSSTAMPVCAPLLGWAERTGITPSSPAPFLIEAGLGHLRLAPALFADTANYTCVVSNPVSNASVVSSLMVLPGVPTWFSAESARAPIAPSILVQFGVKMLVVNWLQPDMNGHGEEPNLYALQYRGVDAGGVEGAWVNTTASAMDALPLRILTDLDLLVAGAVSFAFRAAARNKQGQWSAWSSALDGVLPAPLLPAFTDPQLDFNGTMLDPDPGGSVTLSAPASGLPLPAYKWYRNGVLLVSQASSSLTLASVDKDVHDGVYHCAATNYLGAATSRTVEVNVNVVPSQPLLEKFPAETVAYGAVAVFKCTVLVAKPAATFQWMFNGTALPSSGNSEYLTVQSASASKEGVYRCEAHNSAGAVNSSSLRLVLDACAAGRYRVVSGQCLACPRGKYQPREAQWGCGTCPAGQYQDIKAQAACRDCGLGTATNTTESAVCIACAVGQNAAALGKTDCDACLPGKYSAVAGTVLCFNCQPGQSQASVGSTACANCSAGTVAPAVSSLVCTACAAGKFQAGGGQGACKACQAGWYSFAGAVVCSPCEAGKYASPTEGKCVGCAQGRFTNSSGRSECDWCEDNSVTSFERTACVCVAGFSDFGPAGGGKLTDTVGGVACRACPEGANCVQPGTTFSAMTSMKDFWQIKAWFSATPSSIAFEECPVPGTCLGGAALLNGSSCLEGHEGVLCGTCKDTFKRNGKGRCKRCSDADVGASAWVVFVLFLAIPAAMAWGMWVTCVRYVDVNAISEILFDHGGMQELSDASKIVTSFLQVITNFKEALSIKFGDELTTLFAYLSMINLDVQSLDSLRCRFSKPNYMDEVLTVTLLPVFITAGLLVLHILCCVIKKGMLQTWQGGMKFWLMSLFLMYPKLCSTILRTFDCRKLADGSEWLHADLSIQCSDGGAVSNTWAGEMTYAQLHTYAVFMILVYVLGIPVLFGSILGYQQWRGQLYNADGEKDAAGLPCEPNKDTSHWLGVLYLNYGELAAAPLVLLGSHSLIMFYVVVFVFYCRRATFLVVGDL